MPKIKKKMSESCNIWGEMPRSPALNVQSENSLVKVGDEYSFGRKVLIVMPGDELNEVGHSNINGERKRTCARSDESEGEQFQFYKGRFNRGKRWLHCQSPASSRTALTALTAVFILIVLLLSAISYYLVTKRTGDATPVLVTDLTDYVNRSIWGSDRKCPYYQLDKRVRLVIIHHTAGTFCDNFSECQRSVKNSQMYYQSIPYYCDIRFGFLIGGDCRIYEGRNFSRREEVHSDPYFNRSVEVSLIGNYSRYRPSNCQVENLLSFLKSSVSADFLDKNFKVVGALQIFRKERLNPGKYLMDRIMQWDMWTNDTTTVG